MILVSDVVNNTMKKGKQICHIILTRFNLPLQYGSSPRSRKGYVHSGMMNDVYYLEERFRLFDAYTMKSIIKQDEQSFKWLVFFWDKTPDRYKEVIRRYREEYPAFIPVFMSMSDVESINDFILKTIMENADGQYVITTRLDNDDMIDMSFVSRIRIEAHQIIKKNKPETDFVLSFPYGLQYQEKRRHIKYIDDEQNHFVSLCSSSVTGLHHIFEYNHALVKESNDLVLIDAGHPMWIEVLHSTNHSNEECPGRMDWDYVRISEICDRYGIELESKKDFLLQNIRCLISIPVYYLRRFYLKYFERFK